MLNSSSRDCFFIVLRCDDALNFTLSDVARREGNLITRIISTSSLISLFFVIIFFETNDGIVGGVLCFLIVGELSSFITSLTCVNSPLLVPAELTKVYLMGVII